jgi:hypothetical protein
MEEEKENYTPSLDELIIIDDEAGKDIPYMEDFEESEENTSKQEFSESKEDQEQKSLNESEEKEEEDVDIEIEEKNSLPLADKKEIKEDAVDEVLEPLEQSDTQLESYYNFLSQAGVMNLPKDYKFDGTQEGFLQAIEDSKIHTQQALISEVWEQLSPDFQTILEYGLEGGKNVKEILEAINNTPVTADQFDLENDNHQREIVRQYLSKTTKYSEKKINDRIRMFENSDVLEQEAEAALNELKEFNRAERQQLVEQQKQTAALEQEEMLKAFEVLQNVTNNMQVSDSRKEQIMGAVWGQGNYNNKTQSYFNYVDELIHNSPEHYAQLVNLYLDYDPVKGFNTSKVKSKKAKTEATVNLRNSLNSLLQNSLPENTKTKRKNSTNDFDFETFNKFNS